MTKDQQIADAIISHAVDLTRLESGLRKKVIAILGTMRKELAAKLSGGELTEFGRQSTARLLREATEIINGYYAQAGMVVDAGGIAETTAKATEIALNAAMVDVAVTAPSSNTLAALAKEYLIDGAPSAAWWAKQSSDMAFKFASAVRQGIGQAETNGQIIRRVQDAIGVSQRNAAALVQTSVQAVANDARMATFKANDDIIGALRWLATLDARVCVVCAARDGLEWKLDGTPINHGVPFSNPPVHFNDRCVLVPRTKTFRELGIDIDEPAPPMRATAGGPTSDNFDQFLERKGAAYQDEIFGPGRAKLYRDGVITRNQLLDQNGNALTLKQLRAKYE